jgi:hypothetical protein
MTQLALIQDCQRTMVVAVAMIGFACFKRPLTLALSRGSGNRPRCSRELRRPERMRRTQDMKASLAREFFSGSQQ